MVLLSDVRCDQSITVFADELAAQTVPYAVEGWSVVGRGVDAVVVWRAFLAMARRPFYASLVV